MYKWRHLDRRRWDTVPFKVCVITELLRVPNIIDIGVRWSKNPKIGCVRTSKLNPENRGIALILW